MARAFVIVLDSLGIGGAPDADQYFCDGVPDSGANTLGHIADHFVQSGPELCIPNLCNLGIGAALYHASGHAGLMQHAPKRGVWSAATESSKGKDTPSGHWELAGHPVDFDWHYFANKSDSFPADIHALVREICGNEMLGDCHAPGTAIIDRLGAEHLRTGRPICYTSVDSVFQIAAHEEVFGLEALYDLCAQLAPHLHALQVGRVIARPFVGDLQNGFTRTAHRRDYAMKPPKPLLCQWAQEAGRYTLGIGKTADIFAHQGFSASQKGDDQQLMQHLLKAQETLPEGGLCFANFVEFDSVFGHRRDPEGYGAHLEWFDRHLPFLLKNLDQDDLMIITADHGNDPTWRGTDHTREQVPVLATMGRDAGPAKSGGSIAFADVSAHVARHLSIQNQGTGKPIIAA